MPHYKLTKSADQKLEKIVEYTLLHFGELQADKYYNSLHETFVLLSIQPNIGRPFFEYHRHEHESHVIYYKVEQDFILIVNILHAREETEGKL